MGINLVFFAHVYFQIFFDAMTKRKYLCVPVCALISFTLLSSVLINEDCPQREMQDRFSELWLSGPHLNVALSKSYLGNISNKDVQHENEKKLSHFRIVPAKQEKLEGG